MKKTDSKNSISNLNNKNTDKITIQTDMQKSPDIKPPSVSKTKKKFFSSPPKDKKHKK
jgi:hypothetical protein